MPDHLRPLQRSKKQKETFKFYAIYEQLPLECVKTMKYFCVIMLLHIKTKEVADTAFNATVNVINRWKRNQ